MDLSALGEFISIAYINSRCSVQNVCEAVFAGLSAAKSTSAPQPPVKAVGLKALHVTGEVHYDELEDFIPAAAPKPSNALREGDVLVAVRGSLPKAALVRDLPASEIYATGNIGVLRPGAEIDPYFLWASITALCVEPGAPKYLDRANVGADSGFGWDRNYDAIASRAT